MKRFIVLVVVMGFLGGCAREEPKSGVEIKTPGVEIKANKKGVDVKVKDDRP